MLNRSASLAMSTCVNLISKDTHLVFSIYILITSHEILVLIACAQKPIARPPINAYTFTSYPTELSGAQWEGGVHSFFLGLNPASTDYYPPAHTHTRTHTHTHTHTSTLYVGTVTLDFYATVVVLV